MPWIAGQFKGVVSVQNFTGMEPEKAIQLGKKNSLIVRIDSSAEYSSQVKEGGILKQRPPYGTQVKKGRQVWVTISKGRRQIVVPKVLGLSVRQAEILFQQSDLKLGGVIRKSQPSVPKGVVFQTNPPMGSNIEVGTQIQVYVSKGGKELSLDLVGLSLKQAQLRIEKMGYSLGDIQYVPQEEVLPNTVLSQNPVHPIYGKPIHLIVSQ